MDRDVPERHAALLRRQVGLPELAELPAKLVDKYWELKRCGDPIDDGITVGDLKWLVFHLGLKRSQEVVAPTIRDLWKKKKLKPYSPLLATFRGEEQEVKFKRFNPSGEVSVEFPDGSERNLKECDVRVAELVGA